MINDLAARITKIVDDLGNFTSVGRMIGRTDNTIRKWCNGDTEPKASDIMALVKVAGVNIDWFLTGFGDPESGEQFVQVPIYDVQLSAGHGDIATRTSTLDYVPFTPSLLLARTGRADGKGLALFEARGDSMEPTIEDGDLVMVDLQDQHKRDGIFAFSLENQARIKRMQFTFAGTNIMSDNSESYQHEIITGEQLNELNILGRVIWRMGKL